MVSARRCNATIMNTILGKYNIGKQRCDVTIRILGNVRKITEKSEKRYEKALRTTNIHSIWKLIQVTTLGCFAALRGISTQKQ